MVKTCSQLLQSLGGKFGNLVVLATNDVYRELAADFESTHPGRQWNLGLSFTDLIDTAAGMAAAGKLPFVCSSAKNFTGVLRGNMRDTLCEANMNVKCIGVGAPEDISSLENLPNLKIYRPKDKAEIKDMLIAAIENYGPVFIVI